MIGIVDYGLGNVQAFISLYKSLGISATRAKTPEDLKVCEKIILPGVGAFDHAVELLNESGLRDTLDHCVAVQRMPVLGVCVGMQILAERSEEGVCTGLGWIPGTIRALQNHPQAAQLPVPHMGWNDVSPQGSHSLFENMSADMRFYFLHSYYFDNTEPTHCIARSTYGFELCSAVAKDNVMGVQFHPEKGHHWGMQLLKNFATGA